MLFLLHFIFHSNLRVAFFNRVTIYTSSTIWTWTSFLHCTARHGTAHSTYTIYLQLALAHLISHYNILVLCRANSFRFGSVLFNSPISLFVFVCVFVQNRKFQRQPTSPAAFLFACGGKFVWFLYHK